MIEEQHLVIRGVRTITSTFEEYQTYPSGERCCLKQERTFWHMRSQRKEQKDT
jgi:hypothetical protein